MLPIKFERRVNGREATLYPEPTKAILFGFTTAMRWFKWDESTPSYPISTTRVIGIPQPDVRGLRPLSLGVSMERGLIVGVRYAVLDSGGSYSTGMANVERYREEYERYVIEPLIESQARASWGTDLAILEFQSCGATSLADEDIFKSLVRKARTLLFHRRITPIRLLQIGEDLRDLREDELEKRMERIREILRACDLVNIVFEWPVIYSTVQRKVLDRVKSDVRSEVNRLMLFWEELASYEGEELSAYRQPSDITRYSWNYTPTKVMSFEEFERAMRKGDWTTLYKGPVDVNRAVLVVHGFSGEVAQATKLFEDVTKSDRIIAAMRPGVYGMKAVVLGPRSEEELVVKGTP